MRQSEPGTHSPKLGNYLQKYQRIAKEDNLKRPPGIRRKRILNEKNRRRVTKMVVENPLFLSAKIAKRASVKG